ncbi:MAG TPA: phosphoenolpyruvate carboxykinase (ATP), partial [Alphaproteobacteria bacterium]|nr:phosphoenolpyruvate carboxykinase (ATP) [Alphaproteobacteria bacterium]
SGDLAKVKFVKDGKFGLMIPESAEGVPTDILHPREMWKDKAAYDATASKLVSLFTENFKKFADKVGAEINSAGMGQ